MKRRINILIFSLILIIFESMFSLTVAAHPGRTDENGGHYDHSTGEYHYHGEPDKDSSSSNSSSNSSSSDFRPNYSSQNTNTTSDGNSSIANKVTLIVILAFIGFFILFPIINLISDHLPQKENHKKGDSSPIVISTANIQLKEKKLSAMDYRQAINNYSLLAESIYIQNITNDAIAALERLRISSHEKFEHLISSTSPKEWALRQLTYRILIKLNNDNLSKTLKNHYKKIYTLYMTKALEEGYIDKSLYNERIDSLAPK